MTPPRRTRAVHAVALAVAAAAVFPRAAAQAPAPAPGAVRQYGYEIVRTFPHDPTAFTQGLVYRDGDLYESTGLNGRSSLRQVRLETGDVIRQRSIDDRYFAEGLTDWHDALIQLTWQTHVGFVYDIATFARRGTFSYTGEGWGLTHDATRLILSDGSSTLRFLDPASFREIGHVLVTERAQPVDQLNELEWVNGSIFANVWQTESIVVIAPDTGRVTARVDLRGLMARASRDGPVDVFNGVAYDAAGDRLFVTGKLWPMLFQIRLVPR